MINYTCVGCNVELRCLKNNVPLIHFLDDNVDNGIDALVMVDVYVCPKCGNKVTTGHSKTILGYNLPSKTKKDILDNEYIVVKRLC
jgi:predicted RNA-binding Zn-ribbon protein involved in translation (DUF1610 family)